MANDYCTPLDITQIEQNFAEINPAMSPAEAMQEANRCLYCYDAPCIAACPTGIDVPSFIKKIASGNVTGAARVIFDANPIGATCARVCPVEVLCEGSCVEKTLVKKPIEIGRLQRYATDHVLMSGTQLFETAEPNGLSVGIIGSGPAGLSCAAYLARLGYAVTVYERREKPGGLNTYGMAEYKMTQAASLAEVAQIERLGVTFAVSTEIVAESQAGSLRSGGGGDVGEARALARAKPSTVPFKDLLREHDAIFLGVGLGDTDRLNIPGEDLDGVIDALSFIEQIKTRDWRSVPLGHRVAVIGAGNTAIDAATQAKRLGAGHVMMVYRRTEKDAPAYDYEIELAKTDGIEFHWQTTPIEILGDGRVTGLRCTRADGTKVVIECDLVIKAIGQTKMGSFFTDVCGVEIDDKGRVLVNEKMQTSDPKIFAGGDCANGGKEAVDAAQMGKLAAQAIHQSLLGMAVCFAGG